ncbi:MAG: MerR family transcriptional regulator [Chloroflexi bacterium]|nr:MerR family transcriptional regulator [Chloroflexota bacterium]
MLGLHPNTLRRYANDRKIPPIKTDTGLRLYNVEA